MSSRDFRLPDLGEGLEDAELVRWLVAEGDVISLNQPLVEVDTAKAMVEIPSPFAGTVSKLHAGQGDIVKVGAALVTFEIEEDESPSKRTAVLVGYGVEESAVKRRRRLTSSKVSGSARSTAPEASTRNQAEAPGNVTVSAAPPVRRLATELGVDLATLKGTGPQGRITREDVQAAAGSEQSSPTIAAGDEVVPLKGARRLIAQKMARSVREIPHVTTYLTVDATALLAVKDQMATAFSVRVTPLAVIAKAFTQICQKHRFLNASFNEKDSQIHLRSSVHLGIATDTDRGLVVPVVRDAQSKSIAEIADEVQRLSKAVRANHAEPSQLTGSTVTISNVGSFGAEFGTPIINHPEASILATGVIKEQVVARSGEMFIAPMMILSLSFDHRIIDGADAGRAMNDLKALLEDQQALSGL
ncbi:MAG: dihydrolipoamide acetyltransferase family protein [Actinomycetota bacterium]